MNIFYISCCWPFRIIFSIRFFSQASKPQFSLYSLLRRSTITHQKRLGMDRIHGLSVDNQIFCTTSDLSVLSGAFTIFLSVWCQLHLSKDFCKVEKGIIFKLYNQQNHFLRVDQTFSIKKVKIFKIMILAWHYFFDQLWIFIKI